MKFKYIITVFLATFTASLLLRTGQILTLVDERGFIIKNGASKNFICILILIALFAATAISALYVRRCPLKAPKMNAALCVTSAILGVWMIYDSITLNSPISVPAWQSSMLSVFGLLSGAVFIAYAATVIEKFKLKGIAFIIPIVYWMLRLVWIFTALNTLALTMEHVFLLACCSAILLFMLQLAKVQSSIESEKSFRRICVFGLAALVLVADYALPNIALKIFDFKDFESHGVSSEILIFITAIFISVFFVSYFHQSNLIPRHKKHQDNDGLGIGKNSFYLG